MVGLRTLSRFLRQKVQLTMTQDQPTPLMKVAAEAARRVATWSKAKQDYAQRVVAQGRIVGEESGGRGNAD